MVTNVATEKQVAFIEKLLTEKQVPAGWIDTFGPLTALSSRNASTVITELMRFPRKPSGADKVQALSAALMAVPKSYYAIRMEDIGHALTSTTGDNDILFVRVDEYAKRRYIKQVHGAPGGFWSSRLRQEDAIAVLKHIETDPLKFSTLFAEEHKVCGKCGADLTDPESRRLKFGPTCRKAWGL